ncbi:hypothetical protein J7J63_00030, partial [Candidatus Bipolaricaulota bacterium]|nr:hypothetical protein [Candidatus Bipolaricaulota bacterium]
SLAVTAEEVNQNIWINEDRLLHRQVLSHSVRNDAKSGRSVRSFHIPAASRNAVLRRFSPD